MEDIITIIKLPMVPSFCHQKVTPFAIIVALPATNVKFVEKRRWIEKQELVVWSTQIGIMPSLKRKNYAKQRHLQPNLNNRDNGHHG